MPLSSWALGSAFTAARRQLFGDIAQHIDRAIQQIWRQEQHALHDTIDARGP